MNKKELWKKYWDEQRDNHPERIFDPENLFNFFNGDEKDRAMNMMWWAYSHNLNKESSK